MIERSRASPMVGCPSRSADYPGRKFAHSLDVNKCSHSGNEALEALSVATDQTVLSDLRKMHSGADLCDQPEREQLPSLVPF